MKLFDLSGKVALVTGGNGGIGLAMAKAIGEAGASVVIAGRNNDKNKKSVELLKILNIECISHIVDVTDENSCNSLIDNAVNDFGKLNILVNNAGTNIRKRPEEYELEFAGFLQAENIFIQNRIGQFGGTVIGARLRRRQSLIG